MENQTICERIGGRRLVGVCVEELYKRVLRDEELLPFFTGVNVQRLKQHQAKFLTLVFSEKVKTDKRYVESVRVIHAHMAVNEKHFERVCLHLVGALKELKVKPELIRDIATALAPFRHAFVTKSTIPKKVDNRSILEKLGGKKALDLCVEEGTYRSTFNKTTRADSHLLLDHQCTLSFFAIDDLSNTSKGMSFVD